MKRKNGFWNQLSMQARVVILVILAIVGCLLFNVVVVNVAAEDSSILQAVQAVGNGIILVCFFAAHFTLIRCPHCGAWLGRDFGRCCRNCGREVDPSDD